MKTFQSTMSAPKKINLHNNEVLPVFKVNFEGDILYANSAAMQLLYQFGVSANRKVPKKFIDEHDEIFKMHRNTDVLLNTAGSVFAFDVVSYYEAGYIGFYSNRIKH